MDREQIQLETRLGLESETGLKTTQQGLTLWETRKINEQNLNEMKLRMHEHIQKKTQEFRDLKHEVKLEVNKETELVMDEKKQEVTK